MKRNDEINKTIGANVNRVRKQRKIKVVDLCKRVGITSSSLSLYINGKRSIPADVLFKLSKELDVAIDYLCGTPYSEGRKESTTFDCYDNESVRRKVIISNEEDNLLFFKNDDFSYEYYLKTSEIAYGKKMLVSYKDKIFKATIYKTDDGFFSLLNHVNNVTSTLSLRRLNLEVIPIGIFAGRVNKEIETRNFL